jgi:ubiquitin carboxyl-terminal hydrolase 14
MPVFNVTIKHSGKAYDVKLDTDQPPAAFRQSIYELTGVPVDRMKVMIKGGVLKVKPLDLLSYCII